MNVLPVKPSDSETRWVAHLAGSFNPVHEGHLAIALKLVAEHGFDEVVFAINSSHYPKAGLASEGDRLAMLQAAIAGEPRFRASTYELDREDWVRTADAVQALSEELEKDGPFRLFTVRGGDWLARLAKWKAAERLAGLCDLIVVGRSGTDTPEEYEWPGEAFELDTAGVPDVSSTEVRLAIRAGRTENLPIAAGVLDEIRARGLYGLVVAGEGWITIQRPGYGGKAGAQRDREREEVYGPGGFRSAFQWGDRVITYDAALMLYEDAYLEHLKTHPEDLEWLVATACEVYDNSDSNVSSKTHYHIQEALSTHLQDIALRRCLIRLGREFRGDHLVEVRGHRSEGYRLNPGKIAFHRPDLIVRPPATLAWCEQGSVELFWQSNKVLQVKERAFSATRPLYLFLLVEDEAGHLLMETEDGDPRRFPELRFDRGEDYEDWLRTALAPYGLTAADLTPSFAEPLVLKDGVHAIVAAGAARVLPPENTLFVEQERVGGARPPKHQSKLLKKHRRSLPKGD